VAATASVVGVLLLAVHTVTSSCCMLCSVCCSVLFNFSCKELLIYYTAIHEDARMQNPAMRCAGSPVAKQRKPWPACQCLAALTPTPALQLPLPLCDTTTTSAATTRCPVCCPRPFQSSISGSALNKQSYCYCNTASPVSWAPCVLRMSAVSTAVLRYVLVFIYKLACLGLLWQLLACCQCST
jgi:hypothetical protein